MVTESAKRAEMPKGNSSVLDIRTVQNDYSTLLSILTPGLRVLDVGCGTGAITKGIAELVGKNGHVVGIDSSAHLIAKGKNDFADVANLELVEADLFSYDPAEKFDLVVSARVLQWLSNPQEALLKLKEFLKPGGQISVLDYDHTRLYLQPEPPATMQRFYELFLKWRADAGMNNRIIEDMPTYFKEAGFGEIEVFDADEVYRKGEEIFLEKVRIWLKVAELRGPQMVESGYLSEEDLQQVMIDYQEWTATEAELMIMRLKEVRARVAAL